MVSKDSSGINNWKVIQAWKYAADKFRGGHSRSYFIGSGGKGGEERGTK